jgi:hypothetical protein
MCASVHKSADDDGPALVISVDPQRDISRVQRPTQRS